MRFKDEKHMWYSDTELLARILANKTQQQVQEILDEHDVIKLKSGDRPEVNAVGRMLLPVVVVLVLLPMAAIKWIVTGDRFLDVIYKRYSWFTRIVDYCGIK